ncbi:hypothetical protein HYH02_003098 [Chlamydomonas schloesseri]|uniref:BTB domain-containing protein n=1 Tax=Chlamydomonas schloesseri TaxID=2026947 RepID=A0A836B9T5_9CHLO|nr:hypothetical protein HYH02_003098 [Chlamydomonas schloesseri]|eukprot:KAG2452062.1 hypothetical protein HYH02_003098 [Chlamydomonas schloesseri]
MHAATDGLDLVNRDDANFWPVWDSWSRALYFGYGVAVLRLVGDRVTLVAGSTSKDGGADGAGPDARFNDIGQLASDGAGSLYMCDRDRIRRIQLPTAWCAGAEACQQPATVGGETAGAAGDTGAQAAALVAGAAGPAGAAAEAAAAAAVAVVDTLRWEGPSEVWGLAFVPAAAVQHSNGVRAHEGSSSASGCGAGWLVFSTHTAMYRLPLPLPLPLPVGGDAAAPAPLEPQLLAGSPDVFGYEDGRGCEAHFDSDSGLAVDAEGNIYLTDGHDHSDDCRVRRVSPDGTVTTLVTDMPHDRWWSLAILPNGYPALAGRGPEEEGQLLLIDLGLTPPVLPRLPAAGVAGAGLPPPRSLPADLGALLNAQPDGTADLVVRVGERRFPVHRAILSARCDYFKQRLAGDGLLDARAAELELPDADPDAFALLLRWLYTGGADVPSDQARSVAELADRLLLPELCAEAQGVVASSVTAGSVVDCLLWAWGCCESRGDAFAGLLAQLKEWYVSHHEEVRRDAGPSRKRLAVEAPDLHLDLTDMVVDWQRGAKRQRSR